MENKSKSKKSVYKEIIDWLQAHDGNLPRRKTYVSFAEEKDEELLSIKKMLYILDGVAVKKKQY